MYFFVYFTYVDSSGRDNSCLNNILTSAYARIAPHDVTIDASQEVRPGNQITVDLRAVGRYAEYFFRRKNVVPNIERMNTTDKRLGAAESSSSTVLLLANDEDTSACNMMCDWCKFIYSSCVD